MELIPTKLKHKLPKNLSYPLGAKEISEALQETPQYSLLSITFRDRDTFWASKFNERLKNKEKIKIVEVEYYRPKGTLSTPKDWLEKGYADSNWKITVYSLPKEHRHQANAALNAQFLPKLAKWLREIGNTEEYTSHRKTYGIELSSCEIQEI